MDQRRVCAFRPKGKTISNSRVDTTQHDEQPLIPTTEGSGDRRDWPLRNDDHNMELDVGSEKGEHTDETENVDVGQGIPTPTNTPRPQEPDESRQQLQYPQYPQDHPTIPPIRWHLYEITGRSSHTWWQTHQALRSFRRFSQRQDGPQWQDPFPNTTPLDASPLVDDTRRLTAAALEAQNRAALSNTARIFDDGDPYAVLPENGMVSTSGPPPPHTVRQRPLRKIKDEMAAIEKREVNRAKTMMELQQARREHDALLKQLRTATLEPTKHNSVFEQPEQRNPNEKRKQGDDSFQDIKKENQLPAHAANSDVPLTFADLEDLEPLTRAHSQYNDVPPTEHRLQAEHVGAIVMRPAGLYQNATTFTSNGKGLATESMHQAADRTDDLYLPEVPLRSPLRPAAGNNGVSTLLVNAMREPVLAISSEPLTVDEIVRRNFRTAEEVNEVLDREMERFRSRTRGISISSVVTAVYVGAQGEEPEQRSRSRFSTHEDINEATKEDGHGHFYGS